MHTAPLSNPVAAVSLLRALADQDFGALVDALEPDATMRALLPSGQREWSGAAEIGAAFERWFGDTRSYELADATADRIGDLLALRWRLRLRAERFGDRAMTVEQQAYVVAGSTGRIARLSLLCSGFWPHDDANEARP